MSARTLVTHASDAVTAELARQVADVLRDRWIEADLVPFERVRGLEAYDCVVLGFPLVEGSPPPEFAAFLARHRRLLGELPAALFWHRPPGEPAAVRLTARFLAARAQLQPVSVGDFVLAGEGAAPDAWRHARRWSAQLSWTLDCVCNPEPLEPAPPWALRAGR